MFTHKTARRTILNINYQRVVCETLNNVTKCIYYLVKDAVQVHSHFTYNVLL